MENRDDNFEVSKEKSINRFYFGAIGFLLFAAVLAARFFWIQLIDGNYYRSVGKKQYDERLVLKSNRGIIYDRNGVPLVTNQINYSIGIDPYMVGGDASIIANKFARVFGKSNTYYLSKIRQKTSFVWLERGISEEKKNQLGYLNYPAIVEVREPSRLYRYNEKAGQLLGFTNIDNKGISGIELQYDSFIKGKDGWMMMQRDGLGQRVPTADYPRQDPINGKNIYLTLDILIQSIVDEELKKGVEEAGGSGGMAVMMIPQTGEIVALSSYPDFDPNLSNKLKIEDSRIKAITDAFEPGSTFKLVTAAAALETGVRKPTDKVNAEHGRFKVLDRVVVDHEPLGTVTFRDGVVFSSNIVMAKTSKLIGEERFYHYARNFGFGMETGVDLPGEIKGELRQPLEWSGVSLPWMSFGYEMLVTPLQVLNAYSTVANNGTLVRPHVLKEIVDSNGKILESTKDQPIRSFLKSETIDTLKSIFEEVVDRGTAKSARVNGLSIAGKTGTAQKNISGKYEKKYMASFVGFFPVAQPVLSGIVIIDSPAKGFYGGAVSAPIFGRVAQRVMASSQVGSNHIYTKTQQPDSVKNKKIIPNLKGLSVDAAMVVLEDQGIEYRLDDKNGKYVLDTEPTFGNRIAIDSKLKIQTKQTSLSSKTMVPNVKGMSLRKGINEFQALGYQVKVLGSGLIKSQQILNGKNKTILLIAENNKVSLN